MNLFFKKLAFTFIILSFSSVVLALPDITGHWRCMGHDPVQHKDIRLSGQITKTGDIYSLVNWKDEGSNDARSGMAIHNDKMQDSLAVMFWSNANAEHIGFGLYQIKSANKIVGTWTMKHAKVTSEEICERMQA